LRTRTPGNDHDIETPLPGNASGGFPNQALGPIPLDRAADTTRRDHRQPGRLVITTSKSMDDQKTAIALPAPLEDSRDIATATQTINGAQRHRVRPTAWPGHDGDDR
jgi:hypothetical protein